LSTTKEIQVNSLHDLEQAAQQLLDFSNGKKVILFYGEMGSGKTTFIKAICKALGVKENTSSPTFSIVNEYLSDTNKVIYHFDFYRLKNEQEAYDMGCEEYFYSGNYCFIEWPEKTPSLIPEQTVSVSIEVLGNEKRVFRFLH
jgi:tRNA threonylcarbamoyladenosine biosynthesis protein TsaE